MVCSVEFPKRLIGFLFKETRPKRVEKLPALSCFKSLPRRHWPLEGIKRVVLYPGSRGIVVENNANLVYYFTVALEAPFGSSPPYSNVLIKRRGGTLFVYIKKPGICTLRLLSNVQFVDRSNEGQSTKI